MRRRIAGQLDAAALAALHKPADPETLAREARRLARDGLQLLDIAAALGEHPGRVAAWLEHESEAGQ